MLPETLQTVGVALVKLTASPELAVATRVSGVPTVCVAMLGKVIVCGAKTVNVCDAGLAAA
jgi:hypothetical protein